MNLSQAFPQISRSFPYVRMKLLYRSMTLPVFPLSRSGWSEPSVCQAEVIFTVVQFKVNILHNPAYAKGFSVCLPYLCDKALNYRGHMKARLNGARSVSERGGNWCCFVLKSLSANRCRYHFLSFTLCVFCDCAVCMFVIPPPLPLICCDSKLGTCGSLCTSRHDRFLLSICSCVSPDVYEWRSMQLQEALPLPSWLHRSALPVSAPSDAASSGSARQQAACLHRVFEARWPETWRVKHRAYTADANTLSFYFTIVTPGASLIRRYQFFTSHCVWCVSFLLCLLRLCFQCRSMCVFTTHQTPLWSFNLLTNQTTSLLTRQGRAWTQRGTNQRGAASRRPHQNKQWVYTTAINKKVDLHPLMTDNVSPLSFFSATAPRFRFWPIRRIAVAAWGIHGGKTSVISAPSYQVSHNVLHLVFKPLYIFVDRFSKIIYV